MSLPVSGEPPAPKCPECGADLKLGPSGKLDAWSCPAGHGIALTLSEAYERLEDDEIHAIWKDSETAPQIELIRKTFDHDLDEAQADEESRGFANKLANHVVTDPGFVGFLDHAVYGHELDDMDEHQHAA
jgi:hypothetical protein